MDEAHDAVIIGGDAEGLVAATYLAQAGRDVVLVEAGASFGGGMRTAALSGGYRAPLMHQASFVPDTRVVQELNIPRFGLRFARRDRRSLVLGEGGRHLLLTRSRVMPRGNGAGLSESDRRAYGPFMREILRLARWMRPLWKGNIKSFYTVTDDAFATLTRGLYLADDNACLLESLCRSSANAYLDRWFETDTLKAALAFDAMLGGLSPQETGSALMLVWRAAQDYWGQPVGGPGALTAALERAARAAGAALHPHSPVKTILVEDGRAAGVVLENGFVIKAGAVLSTLDARRTLESLVPPGAMGFGAAARVPGPQ
jgi:phytoene dehydrogenase-like protein